MSPAAAATATDPAVRALCAVDPDLARVAAGIATLPTRDRPAGFRGLASIMVQQQVSLASAAAIWARLEARLGAVTADRLAAESDAVLLACGLSRPKLRYLRAAAAAVADGSLQLQALPGMPVAAARDALTAVTGIGRWTADIYLLSALGHPDIWPAHDLALQVALQAAKGLPDRPAPKAMDAIAESWAPHRSMAARLLWAHYRVIKGRDAV